MPLAPQIRANPIGHDAFRMRGAMGAPRGRAEPIRRAERSAPTPPPRAGKDWGSNVQSGLDARQQARALDTSHDDDEDEEITLC